MKAMRHREVCKILEGSFGCSLQALSVVGRCQTFEASADGYGRGEGFTAVVMRQAGTSTEGVLAIVRGSAVNEDGRSSSLTAPNGPSQQVSLSTEKRSFHEMGSFKRPHWMRRLHFQAPLLTTG